MIEPTLIDPRENVKLNILYALDSITPLAQNYRYILTKMRDKCTDAELKHFEACLYKVEDFKRWLDEKYKNNGAF